MAWVNAVRLGHGLPAGRTGTGCRQASFPPATHLRKNSASPCSAERRGQERGSLGLAEGRGAGRPSAGGPAAPRVPEQPGEGLIPGGVRLYDDTSNSRSQTGFLQVLGSTPRQFPLKYLLATFPPTTQSWWLSGFMLFTIIYQVAAPEAEPALWQCLAGAGSCPSKHGGSASTRRSRRLHRPAACLLSSSTDYTCHHF